TMRPTPIASSRPSRKRWLERSGNVQEKPMPAFICTTCGTQYPPSGTAPANCAICKDERQYVAPAGQSWTTQERLALTHFNAWHEYEPGILGIGTQPRFAIGQRALLLR